MIILLMVIGGYFCYFKLYYHKILVFIYFIICYFKLFFIGYYWLFYLKSLYFILDSFKLLYL